VTKTDKQFQWDLLHVLENMFDRNISMLTPALTLTLLSILGKDM